jgi:hypothetical protein
MRGGLALQRLHHGRELDLAVAVVPRGDGLRTARRSSPSFVSVPDEGVVAKRLRDQLPAW